MNSLFQNWKTLVMSGNAGERPERVNALKGLSI